MNNKKVAFRLPFVLDNTDEYLHAKTSQDNGNPAEGSKENRFTAGLDHGDEIGFETDSAHGHDDKEFGELFERGEEATRHTERGEKSR